jgi:hypothetical protein
MATAPIIQLKRKNPREPWLASSPAAIRQRNPTCIPRITSAGRIA